MESIVSELENQLEATLGEIGREKNRVACYDRSVKEVQHVIGRLHDYLKAYPFAGKSDEIQYFKELAPRIYSRLFYFMKLYQVEAWRPYAGRERFREALEQELAGIARFYDQHKSVCHYYTQQVTYWDDYLFTGSGQGGWSAEEAGLYIGPEFTLGSYWVSWILANEQYKGWLEENLAGLERESGKEKKTYLKSNKLPWKGTVTDLVEVLYSQHLAGSFGSVPFTQVIEFNAEAYDIEILYVNTILQNILTRKKGPVKYLAVLVEGLEKKAEERG